MIKQALRTLSLAALVLGASIGSILLRAQEVMDVEEGFFQDSDPPAQLEEVFNPEALPTPQLDFEPDAISEPLPQISKEPKPIQSPLSRPREEKIKHPLSEKGLRRIKADGTYLFEKEPSPQNHGISVRFGLFEPFNLVNPKNGESFERAYGGRTNPMVLIDYEWQFWKMALGKWSLKLGSGIFVANGNGRFANDYEENRGLTPREVFTFLALPNSIGLTYRMQWSPYQWFVPYANGGVMGFTFAELRDDGESPKFGFSPAAYAAGGLAINLTGFNRSAARILDFEYGINGAYLVGEFKNIFTLGGDFDFSATVINFGFLLEY